MKGLGWVQASDKVKGKANEAGRKAQSVFGNNAGLPSPQEAADKVKGKVDELGRNVQGAGSNNPLSGNVPSPQEVLQQLSCGKMVLLVQVCCSVLLQTKSLQL